MSLLLPLGNHTVDETRLLAVDFGKNGGFAWGSDSLELTYPMPSENEMQEAWKIFNGYKPQVVVGENVHAFTGQGVSSVETLIRNQGIILGMAYASGAQVKLIQPESWTKDYGFSRDFQREVKRGSKAGSIVNDKTAWKNHLLQMARKLFPEIPLCLKTCDAALIWRFIKLYGLPPEKLKPLKI